MEFNFGISAESAVSNARRQLSPWQIHDVTFKGIEIREFDGKKDTSKHYKVMDIKFENPEGYFTVTKFFPREGDEVRRTYDGKNGGKVEMPSNLEEFKDIIKQTVQILGGDAAFEKLQKVSAKFTSFDDMVKAAAALTKNAINKPTQLKLIGRNREGKIVPEIPRIVAISKKTGEAFIADNFIGSKLYFSDYEETQRSKFVNAKPTIMGESTVESSNSALDEIGASIDSAEPMPFDLDSLAD